MGERSLVAFTLLVQTACGALVGLVGVQVLGSSDVLGVVPFTLLGLLLLAAAVGSTLHLGAPRHALNALRNWRRSWLSREVIGLGLVAGLVALGAAIALLAEAEASRVARTAVAVLAAAAGLVLLVTMVRIYSLRTVPEWRATVTATRFGGAALRLGAVAAGILAAAAELPDGALGAPAAWLVVLLLAGLGFESASRWPRNSRDAARPGALLVYRVDAPANSPSVVPMAVGVGIGTAGMVAIGAGPAWLSLLLLAPALAVLAFVDVRLRERFYALAPRRGRDAMRPAGAPSTVSGPR